MVRQAVRAAAPALLPLPPRRPWRGAVNKACLCEADLPLRPARLRPPRPSSALRKPPPAGWPGDNRGNGSTSQVKLCISCVLIANADLGAQKGRDRRGRRRRRGSGSDLASGGRGARGPVCARPARAAGRARRPRRGASAPPARLPPLTAPTSRRRGALPRGGRGPRGCPSGPASPSQGGPQPGAPEGWEAAAGKGS